MAIPYFMTLAEELPFRLETGHRWPQFCGITTIADFRSLDVAMGGQGAPLVPAGDGCYSVIMIFALTWGIFQYIIQ